MIVCCAFPFGYGPAAKLILIARRLRAAGVQTVFVGDGIAHELAARSDVFDAVVQGGASEARTWIARARAVVSLMEREIAGVAIELGTPLYVVDSLRWQRETVPEPFARATRYWTQRFAPGEGGADSVGPIVEPMAARAGAGDQLLIGLGGMDSPHGFDAGYCDFVMAGVLRSELVATYAGRATLIAGARCVAHLRATFRQDRIDVRSVPHERALALVAGAARVVTSPGLTMTLECFQLGVPTYFLPPQNYSQWRTLRLLDRLELSGGAFGWWDALDDAGVANVDAAPEAERTPAVRRVIAREAVRDAAQRRFAAKLERWAADDVRPLGDRQRAHFASLGENGADTVARELRS